METMKGFQLRYVWFGNCWIYKHTIQNNLPSRCTSCVVLLLSCFYYSDFDSGSRFCDEEYIARGAPRGRFPIANQQITSLGSQTQYTVYIYMYMLPGGQILRQCVCVCGKDARLCSLSLVYTKEYAQRITKWNFMIRRVCTNLAAAGNTAPYI